ncbi:MAG: glycosyltransferase, partial [Patescibacteria group bacterium]
FELGDKYLLSLSTLQPRKNLAKLIEAFNKISLQLGNTQILSRGRRTQMSQVHNLKLIIAGKIGWLAEEILQTAKKSPFNKNIIFTGFISEKEKKVLFEHALASISISPYEGFGIPALEALQYGSIPLIANDSSLPEVVGEAGILVDPQSLDSIAGGIREILNFSAKKRAEYKKLGRERVKKFSWKKSARIVLKTLEEVASEK